jgi:predicted negative regulator of RcsB-dependent stress response
MWSGTPQLDRAKGAYTRAIESGDRELLPLLRCNLALVEQSMRQYDAALATLHLAIEASDPVQSTRALYLAGNLYDEQLNNGTEAKQLYNQAMLSANDKWSSWAALYCGLMLRRGGDLQGAVAALHQAATRSDEKACMGQAKFELGKLYTHAGRTDIGHTYLEQAAASGRAKWEGEARKLLIETEQASQPSSGGPVAPPMQQPHLVREAASPRTFRGGPTEVALSGQTAAELPVVDVTATFQDQCEKWRLWAARELAGSEVQVAAAGDAAALTGLLGGNDTNDFVAAARLAAGCFGGGLSSTAVEIPSSPVPFGSAERTSKKLAAAGWQPVPLHGHNWALEDGQLIARCRCEDWFWGSGEQKKHRGTEVAGEVVGDLAGGFIGGIVGGVIGAAVAGAQKGGDSTAKWRRIGSCDYLLTENRIVRLTAPGSKVNAYETIRMVLSHKEGGVVIRLMDRSEIMLRMPNSLLHKAVLEHMWKRYHELPNSAPLSALPVSGHSQPLDATEPAASTGPPD